MTKPKRKPDTVDFEAPFAPRAIGRESRQRDAAEYSAHQMFMIRQALERIADALERPEGA